MLSYKQAQRIILSKVSIKQAERISLKEAEGLVLARDVFARLDLPSFHNSAMDGYAVKSSEVKEASEDSPVILNIVCDIQAGSWDKAALKRGEVARIMTGAPLPKGADSVVMVEDTQCLNKKVKIFKSVNKWENVRLKGEDIKKGKKILKRGTLVRMQEITLLAAQGFKDILVYPRVKVAILATGNELMDIKARKLKPAKIFEVNTHMLHSLVRKTGAETKILGIAKDKKRSLVKKITRALRSDILLVCGGVSVGDYDLVKDIFKELGIKQIFWQVKIKPGKPLFFGLKAKKLIFGLPGNPVSALVTYLEFVRPAILKMMGKKEIYLPEEEAILTCGLKNKPGRTSFIRSITKERNHKLFTQPAGGEGSHMLASLTRANSLIVVKENIKNIKKGERIKVQLINA